MFFNLIMELFTYYIELYIEVLRLRSVDLKNM